MAKQERFATLSEVFHRVKKELANELINQNETIWTYDDLVRELGYKLRSLHNMVALKKIPHHRANGKVYFLKGEIISWIKNDGNFTNNIQQEM